MNTLAVAETTKSKPRSLPIAKLAIRLGAFAAFAVVLLYFALNARGFLSPFNLMNVVEQSTVLGLLAYAMTVVFIGTGTDVQKGGIDLSIAANAGLCGAIYAVTVKNGYSDAAGLLAAVVTGSLVGLLNGFAVVSLRIMPLLATLALMNIAAGLELTITQNTVVGVTSGFVNVLAFGKFLGISTLVWCFLLVTVLLGLFVHYTRTGLRLYAVGGHAEAARAAGINTSLYVYGSYMFSGFLAGVTSILIVSRLSASTPGTSLLLLPLLSAALLGTVFSRRFVPTIGGTFLATLFIGFLANGFQLLGISSYWVSGVQGALILLVVAVTSVAKKS
ncbi:MAG: ABC transporter permease [Rhizobiaceae bacterium]|nr:ABC transporter permease [Rhizobiaceae bacterium]